MAISANHTPIEPFSLGGLVSYAIVYTAPMYPATDPDLVSTTTSNGGAGVGRNRSAWAQVAARTLQNLPPVPYNGAQQIWNAATRLGGAYLPEDLVALYQPLLEAGIQKWPNFRVDFGEKTVPNPSMFCLFCMPHYQGNTSSSHDRNNERKIDIGRCRLFSGSSNGMENSGVIDALNDMLMQSWRGYIELFPCWPASRPGAFARLRARGAFLVSAAFEPTPLSCGGGGGSGGIGVKNSGGVNGTVRILSEAGAKCGLRSPWSAGRAVTVREEEGGKAVHLATEDVDGVAVLTWPTAKGVGYVVNVA